MGLFDFFKRTKIVEEFAVRKVHCSEEVNRPGFNLYFTKIALEASLKWDDEGYLIRPDLFDSDKTDFATFAYYNKLMNEAVCLHFGEEKCKKLAKTKRWFFNTNVLGTYEPTMKNKENDGDCIFWWILHEALSSL